jgi:DNA-binding transcriptional LysR family regulator
MFEAAARHLSFTAAARELKVTQAAVSQQVRALEQELGVALFERLHRGLRLTRQGGRLYRAAATGFEHIAGAVDDLRGAHRAPAITIGVTFAVATFWLVPRLPHFRAQHPDIDVHVFATDRGFETVADQVDAGIAYGAGAWAGFSATLLCEGEAFPVCSPEYLRGRPPLRRVAQLAEETLLSLDDMRVGIIDWPLWFVSQGIRGYTGHRNPRFNSHPLLLQAACEGQGVALGWNLLTDDLIEKGRLVRPLDATMRTPRNFYFVMRDSKRTAEAAAFRDWLLGYFSPSAERPALRATAIAGT